MGEDDRTWAERRIDARREKAGLPALKPNRVQERLVLGGVLGVVGVLLIVGTSGLGVAAGSVLCVVAVYQFATAAIAQGVKEGREDR